jgi:hypothetical protein
MSGAASRRKGNRAEVAVVNFLKAHGWDVETSRNARGGTQKGADVLGDFPLAVEVKNQARVDLPGWWRQAQEQAGDGLAVVVHKRVGSSDPGEWWATMDLVTLVDLVRVLRWEEDELERERRGAILGEMIADATHDGFYSDEGK